jgi:hypothetical protein
MDHLRSRLRTFVIDIAPGGDRLMKYYRYIRDRRNLKGQSRADVFNNIFQKNAWKGYESISGPGSDSFQTQEVVRHLPELLRDFGVGSILDVPCGDFNWMQHVDLGDLRYIGGDIVPDITSSNQRRFGNDKRRFAQIDLVSDKLPPVDLILCRDCLVHLSFGDVFQALSNIAKSDARYFLTTHFSKQQPNTDIMTGQWRRLNFEQAPFKWPAPLRVIDEKNTEDSGRFADKTLALWAISDIRTALAKQT